MTMLICRDTGRAKTSPRAVSAADVFIRGEAWDFSSVSGSEGKQADITYLLEGRLEGTLRCLKFRELGQGPSRRVAIVVPSSRKE